MDDIVRNEELVRGCLFNVLSGFPESEVHSVLPYECYVCYRDIMYWI
jgi:hypothetical protein